MSSQKRKGEEKKGEDKRQRTLFEFIPPGLSSPASPSMSDPPSPASSFVSDPNSPAGSSMSDPNSPAGSSMSDPPSPASSSIDKLTCNFCIPPKNFKNEASRKNHEITKHGEEKGFYASESLQTELRSQTRTLMEKYLPVLPDGFTTQIHPADSDNPLGIYIKNEKDQIVGGFYVVVSYHGVSSDKAAYVRSLHRELFIAYKKYSQAHIFPATTAKDTLAMLEASFEAINFEPLNLRANEDVGGSIEAYAQKLHHDWNWKVGVFVLLDKNNILETVRGSNGVEYSVSGNWSYLIFMQRGEEEWYEAFSFPNANPTKSYWNYKTDLATIRRISGLDFQFGMTESITQFKARVKHEAYLRDNPYPCTVHVGCTKRFSSDANRKYHVWNHNPKRVQQNVADAKKHERKIDKIMKK